MYVSACVYLSIFWREREGCYRPGTGGSTLGREARQRRGRIESSRPGGTLGEGSGMGNGENSLSPTLFGSEVYPLGQSESDAVRGSERCWNQPSSCASTLEMVSNQKSCLVFLDKVRVPMGHSPQASRGPGYSRAVSDDGRSGSTEKGRLWMSAGTSPVSWYVCRQCSASIQSGWKTPQLHPRCLRLGAPAAEANAEGRAPRRLGQEARGFQNL